jgi:hypothetical protein
LFAAFVSPCYGCAQFAGIRPKNPARAGCRMRNTWLSVTTTLLCSRTRWLRNWPSLTLLLVSHGGAQVATQPPAGANATASIAQLEQAFSVRKPVTSVNLFGNAVWTAGTLSDSGTVTLAASSGGSAQMQLELASTGSRTELSSGIAAGSRCSWSGNDRLKHDMDPANCWKPLLWFLPAFSIQPSLMPDALVASDLGVGSVGHAAGPLRHLQFEYGFQQNKLEDTKELMRLSASDLGLDRASYLPSVLTYDILSDGDAPSSVHIEVRYADYKDVNGVQVPFTIQRYVNGSLQLDISIQNAEIN